MELFKAAFHGDQGETDGRGTIGFAYFVSSFDRRPDWLAA
jgi:hypothetical protein